MLHARMPDSNDPFGDLPPPPPPPSRRPGDKEPPPSTGAPKGCLAAIGMALTIGVIGLVGGAAVLFVGAYIACMHH